jgi:glycosyltransferase involved in cell wall biosynthesis
MKVALVTSLVRGGPLEVALMSAGSLAAAGVDVHAVCTDQAIATRFARRGGTPHVVGLRRPPDPRGVRALRRALAGVDVAHSHDRRGGFWLRALPRPAGRPAVVHTIHGLPDAYLPPPAGPSRPGPWARARYQLVEGALARRSTLITPSKAIAAALVARLGIPAGHLSVVPNAVDPATPCAGPRDAIGTLSVLEPVKGIDVFLRAAAVVCRERPAQRVVVFGEGSAGPALRATARGLGLDVDFAGMVPAPAALARLAVLAIPSHLENQPMALHEAMAAGVPVVASRVGGIPEATPAGTAALVPPADPAAMAAAISRLLDDPDAGRRQAASARAHVDRHARPEVHARRTLALYEQALAGRR